MHSLRRLLLYVRPYKLQIGLALICLLASQPVQLLHPLFWMFVADEVILADQPAFIDWVGGSRMTLLAAVVVLMFLAYAVGAGIGAVRQYVLGKVAQSVGYDLRHDLYDRFQQHSMRYFHDRRSGDLVARATGDVETVQQFATNGVDEVIGSATQLILVWGIICFVLSWQVALALIAPLAIVGVMIWRFNLKIRPLYRAARDRLGDVSATIQENILGMPVIKAFGREPHEQERVDHENRRYFDTALRSIRVRSTFDPAVQAVGFTSNAVMLGFGGYLVLRDHGTPNPALTIGGLLALRGYWWHLFSPIFSLARINDMFQRSLAASDRVFAAFDEPIEIEDRPDAEPLESVDGRIELRQVTFAYGADEPPVLREADIEVPAGCSLGVAGPSGAGKSTLLSLIMRFYDPTDGVVLIDGHDLRDVRQQALRQQMGVVTQDPFLFAGTVRENIGFGNLDADESQMHEAARSANAHAFIESLPKGYDTIVGERGVKLSGGQKQRICIARAFLADPRILLLDEATSAVEPESEAAIQAALERLMVGRTSVVVSHRLSMLRGANQIIVINHGHIAERGTHRELMAADGWYARMYRLQLGETEAPAAR